MGFLSVIRRWALRDKMSIREIARRTGLSRNTIKKYLREGAVEPRFKTPKRPSKLDPYAERLSAWLLIQTRKSRKERRTVSRLSGGEARHLTRIIHRRCFFGWRTWHKRLNSCMNLLLYSFTTTPTEFPARHARRYPDPARSVTGR